MSKFLQQRTSDDENWLPIADIMTSLFVIFLFISIVAIQNISRIKAILPLTDKERNAALTLSDLRKAKLDGVVNVIADLSQSKEDIYEALIDEFKHDLPKWKAEIDPDTLIFRFREPEILFRPNSAQVRPRFQEILSDFFPRYLAVLEMFFPRIHEVRIEGHTSSEWLSAESEKEKFLRNMELSQDRTQSVLSYCLRLQMLAHHEQWIREKVTANGFSSTRLITREGLEDRRASRRVEFRIYLNEERVIRDINKKVQDDHS